MSPSHLFLAQAETAMRVLESTYTGGPWVLACSLIAAVLAGSYWMLSTQLRTMAAQDADHRSERKELRAELTTERNQARLDREKSQGEFMGALNHRDELFAEQVRAFQELSFAIQSHDDWTREIADLPDDQLRAKIDALRRRQHRPLGSTVPTQRPAHP